MIDFLNADIPYMLVIPEGLELPRQAFGDRVEQFAFLYGTWELQDDQIWIRPRAVTSGRVAPGVDHIVIKDRTHPDALKAEGPGHILLGEVHTHGRYKNSYMNIRPSSLDIGSAIMTITDDVPNRPYVFGVGGHYKPPKNLDLNDMILGTGIEHGTMRYLFYRLVRASSRPGVFNLSYESTESRYAGLGIMAV